MLQEVNKTKMAYSYPPTEPTTNIITLLNWANSVTYNSFTPMILLSFGIVIFIALKSRGYYNSVCFAAASFPVSIIAAFFRLAGVLSLQIMVAAFVLTALSIFWLWREGIKE